MPPGPQVIGATPLTMDLRRSHPAHVGLAQSINTGAERHDMTRHKTNKHVDALQGCNVSSDGRREYYPMDF